MPPLVGEVVEQAAEAAADRDLPAQQAFDPDPTRKRPGHR